MYIHENYWHTFMDMKNILEATSTCGNFTAHTCKEISHVQYIYLFGLMLQFCSLRVMRWKEWCPVTVCVHRKWFSRYCRGADNSAPSPSSDTGNQNQSTHNNSGK